MAKKICRYNSPVCGPIALLSSCSRLTRLPLESRMRQKPYRKLLTEAGPLIVLAVSLALLVGIVGPASAQFFNFGGPPQRSAPRSGGGWVGGGRLVGGGGFFSA